MINVLVDCCRYFCRQCLAFRGSQDEFEGNFNQLVKLLSRWISSIHTRSYHTSYLDGKSQNQFISLIGEGIRSSIVQEIKSAKFFPIMADTTPDKSHQDPYL